MLSACIFGSKARQTSDHLSDRDILVVAPAASDLARASQQLKLSGWSVSAFTRNQILNMSLHGSLFLQHLKQEGRIVRDSDNFLTSTIASFMPSTNNDRLIAETFYLLDVVKCTRDNYWLALCCADIVYVAFRNLAILTLGSYGEYLFDYTALVRRVSDEYGLHPADVSSLSNLRLLKHGYRNRIASLDPYETVHLSLSVVESMFGAQHSNVGKARSNYARLRSMEVELVRESDPRKLDLLPQDDPLAEVWSAIRSPSEYPVPRPREWFDTMSGIVTGAL